MTEESVDSEIFIYTLTDSPTIDVDKPSASSSTQGKKSETCTSNHAVGIPIIVVREDPPDENIRSSSSRNSQKVAKRWVVHEKAPQGKVQKNVGVRLREDLLPAKKGKVQKNVGFSWSEEFPTAKRGKFHMNLRSNEDLPAAKRGKVQKNVAFSSSEDLPAGKRGKFHMNLRSNEDLPAVKRGKFHMNLRSNEDLSAVQTDNKV